MEENRMNKQTEITMQIERRIVIMRKPTNRKTANCPHCSEKVEMLSISEAALIVKGSSRAIFGWCELGWLHSIPSDGLRLICSQSLANILTIK
jgi:hypothetical protein